MVWFARNLEYQLVTKCFMSVEQMFVFLVARTALSFDDLQGFLESHSSDTPSISSRCLLSYLSPQVATSMANIQ